MKFTGERMIPGQNKGQLIYYEHIIRYFFARQFVKGKTVLDVACGAGYGAALLIEAGAKKVLGVDISSESISYARRTYRLKHLSFVEADAQKLPFPDRSFDVVVSFETLEHLRDPRVFLSQLKRVLAPGGTLVMSTPNGKAFTKGANPFHYREFTAGKVTALLKNFFAHVHVYYQTNSSATIIDSRGSKSRANLSSPQSLSKEFSYVVCVASDAKLKEVDARVVTFDTKSPERLLELEARLLLKEDELKAIYRSRGWKLLTKMHAIRVSLPFLKHV